MALPAVQAAIASLGAGAEGFLAAFAAKLAQAGLGLSAYSNPSFVNLITTAANAADATRAFNALSVQQMALLNRLGFSRFAGLPIRRALAFSRLRFYQISLIQMLAYRFTIVRFTGPGGVIAPGLFGAPRSNNDND
jgi:hypothetical protein